MKPEQDAWGQLMLANRDGGQEIEVIERDDGFVSLGGGPMYFAPYAQWRPVEQEASQYVRGRVLDVGCGAGRHALYFQERGHDVVGIDVSPLAVQVCRERGLRDARVLAVTQVSRANVGVFDTIAMWGGNFGLVGSPGRAPWLLRRFHAMTSDQGRIIGGALNPYGTTEPAHLAYHERNRQRGRMGGHVRLRVRFRQYATPWWDLLLVSPDEMRTLLAGTGWKIQRLLGDENGPYIAIIDKA